MKGALYLQSVLALPRTENQTPFHFLSGVLGKGKVFDWRNENRVFLSFPDCFVPSIPVPVTFRNYHYQLIRKTLPFVTCYLEFLLLTEQPLHEHVHMHVHTHTHTHTHIFTMCTYAQYTLRQGLHWSTSYCIKQNFLWTCCCPMRRTTRPSGFYELLFHDMFCQIVFLIYLSS